MNKHVLTREEFFLNENKLNEGITETDIKNSAEGYSLYKNDEGKYAFITSYFNGNNTNYEIIYRKGVWSKDVATRPSFRSTMIKKIIKELEREGYVLSDEDYAPKK